MENDGGGGVAAFQTLTRPFSEMFSTFELNSISIMLD